MYRALMAFRDMEDGHIYQPGDPFPHDGREIKKERLDSLATGQNRISSPVIEQVIEDIKEEPEEAPKPVRGRRKKAE